jgi:hypothetical protein
MEYEAARKLYEEGTTGPISSINFSILPGSPGFSNMRLDFESDSDLSTDEGLRPNRS